MRGAMAWGRIGHEAVAMVAQLRLEADTPGGSSEGSKGSTVLSALFERFDAFGLKDDLSSVANWADDIKYSPAYRFTARLHYVNPFDDEPDVCSLSNGMDCPGGRCVIDAVVKYWRILALGEQGWGSSTSSSIREEGEGKRFDALRFLIHLVGDAHQPLHVSGRQRGGNDARVLFFGRGASLHEVWDSLVLDRMLLAKDRGRSEQDRTDDVQRYAERLFERRTTTYLPPASEEEGSVVDLAKDEVLKWAAETNRENCAVVWSDGYENISLAYYDRAAKIVDAQILRAGERLASSLRRAVMTLEM